MAKLLDIAKDYVSAGLSIIPIKTDGSKAPAIGWKEYQSRIANREEFCQWFESDAEYGIAIITGAVSNNLEILDFDEPTLLKEWSERVLAGGFSNTLLRQLPVIKTPCGWHIYYRCHEPVDGNKKLAQRRKDKGELETLIETRGEGGYVISPGSPSNCHPDNKLYALKRGSLIEIPIISSGDKEVLLNAAASFNELFRDCYTPKESRLFEGIRPGDDFNSRANWRTDILQPAGCRELYVKNGESYWVKPGSNSRAPHATLNWKETDKLYVFSSSFEGLEPMRAYDKYQAYTYLFHGGDFSEATKELVQKGYGINNQSSKPSEQVVQVLQAGNVSIFDENWTEPEPIADILLPVEKLDLEMIPEPFRDWISDTADRMPCPIDFVAAAAIVITGSVIGAGCGVRPKANDDWLELANLWGAIIGVPGKLKSPAIKKPLGLLSKLEAKAKTQHEQINKEYEVQKQEFELTQKKYKSEMQTIIEPAKPSKSQTRRGQ